MTMPIYVTVLKTLRKLYFMTNPNESLSMRNWRMFSQKEYANELIRSRLMEDRPCMIARLGATEMNCLTNYIGVKQNVRNCVGFIKGTALPWWWDPTTIKQMGVWSGFFPQQVERIEQFCEMMLKDIPEIDILASWLRAERYLTEQLLYAKRVILEDMEPFFATNPWTSALKGKKILVVHPFAETIEKQYKKRSLLFEKDLLPEFELKTIKAVQSIAGAKTDYADWFEALDAMKAQIDKMSYDVCIIGCGAYGVPLAAHVKRMGKKSIHLAGVTQLLFGIIGKRWEECFIWPYMNLFNEHWVRPAENEKPGGANSVEGACYW